MSKATFEINDVTYRRCYLCNNEKILNQENFYRDKNKPLGFDYKCKNCSKEAKNKSRKKNIKNRTKITSDDKKACSTCKVEKYILEDFYKDSSTKDGHSASCKDCRSGKTNRRKTRMWTEEEKELLRKHYPYMDNKELHQKYFSYRTVDQVVDHAIKVLKLKKDRKVYRQGWSEEQLEYLRINYEDPNTATAEMEKVLGKDISTIRAMARTMGLNRKRSGSWNREDKEKVFLYYPAMKTSELQKKYLPHKTERQIVGFANRNSILKSEEHLREVRLNQAFKNLEKIKSMSPEERKWGERVKVKCSFCDEDIVKLESKARKSDNHFCDYECMGQWMSENLKGKDNPNYGNGDAWTDEMRKASAKRVVKRLSDSDFKFHRTKPELTTEEILNDLKIPFKSEYDCEYYLIDKYLYEQDLMIEVQGNFFHCNPTMNLENSRETKILRKDTAKNTYIKKYYDIEILYLWEKDLKDDFDKCKKIVQLYIDKNGKLDNYHSFNYEVKNGELKLIDTLVEFSY